MAEDERDRDSVEEPEASDGEGVERDADVDSADGDDARDDGADKSVTEDGGEKVPGDKDAPMGPLPIETLDVCPNCGESMRDTDTLVCIKCGFDLKTLKVMETETGETMVTPEETGASATSGDPLARPWAVDPWAPLALAGLAVAILAVGYLTAQAGLFDEAQITAGTDGVAEVAWKHRFVGLAQFPLLIGIWVLCGFGAFFTGGWMFARPRGDIAIAAARLLAIAATARLTSFISLPYPQLERLVEAGASAAVVFLLIMVAFRLKPRDSGVMLGLGVLAFLVLYSVSGVVAWVT